MKGMMVNAMPPRNEANPMPTPRTSVGYSSPPNWKMISVPPAMVILEIRNRIKVAVLASVQVDI